MEDILDSLFLSRPAEGTIPYLIYESARKFNNQKCLALQGTGVTYAQLDIWSDNLGAYLSGAGYYKNYMLLVLPDGSLRAHIVILAAIKAGITTIDVNGAATQNITTKAYDKSIMTFENDVFKIGHEQISFRKAMETGKGYLFFHIPVLQRTDIAGISIVSTGERMISHEQALKMIDEGSSYPGDIPLINFLYCLKNNLDIAHK